MNTPKILKVAVIQLHSQNFPDKNMAAVEELVDRAAATGAQLVALPELWTYLGPYEGYDQAAQTIPGSAIEMLQEKARKYNIIVHGGSIIERHPQRKGKFYNTSVLINRSGEIAGLYRKIHLFDVELSTGIKHHESERIVPGAKVVTAEVDGITFGLTVCYDLRFPELFRSLVLQGAQIVLVPAAFTLHTGRDHWEVLLRARAIENFCYVVAPAQVGSYPPNKQCFGRAMIVDPWGIVLAQVQDVPTVITTDIDLSQIEHTRRQIPCLQRAKLHWTITLNPGA